jgi:hypothetical protein
MMPPSTYWQPVDSSTVPIAVAVSGDTALQST